MKRSFLALIAILGAGEFAIATALSPSGWTDNGPLGASTPTLYIDPAHPSTLFLTPGFGVYRTLDGGEQWERIRDVGSVLAIARSNPRVLFHADGALLSRSQDGGSTWTVLPALPPGNCSFAVTSAAVDASDPDLVLILRQDGPCTRSGDYYGEILQSRDGGNSWRLVVAFLRSVPRLLAGGGSFWVLGGRLLRSVDGGSSFETVLSTQTDAIDFDPRDTRRVYAAGPDGLRRSLDGGSTWLRTDLNASVGSILVNAADSTEVFARAGEAWFGSGDYGSSWLSYPTGGTDLLASDPTNPFRLYGHDGSEIRRTLDHAATWRPIVDGLKATAISALAVDSIRPGHAWAAAGLFAAVSPAIRTDIYETSDAGRSWHRQGAVPARYVASLTFDPGFGVLHAGGDHGVFHSEDAGKTWSPVFETGGGFAPVVAVSASDSRVVYATGTVLYRSDDRGRNWSALPNLIDPTAVAVDPRNPGIVYASAYDDGTGFVGLMKSSDGGTTWIRLLPSSSSSRILVVDPVEPDNLYAGDSNGLFHSPDGGLTWKATGVVSVPVSLTPHPSRSGELFVLDGRGLVLRSVDHGGSWRLLPNVPDFGCGVRFCAGYLGMSIFLAADVLYVGTFGRGVFIDSAFDLDRARPVVRVPYRP